MSEKEMLYETEFHNRAATAWRVHERETEEIALVAPGEKFTAVSYSPATFWSRYREAVRGRDGMIEVKLNKKWRSPWPSDYSIEMSNFDSVVHSIKFAEVNPLSTPSGYVHIPAGMPAVIVPVSIHDPLVKIRAITWKQCQVELPLSRVSDYFTYGSRIQRVDALRSAEEIDHIVELLAKEAQAKAQVAADKEMAEIRKKLLEGIADAPQEG